MKWIFGRGTQASHQGLVGVHETPDNIAIVHAELQPPPAPPLIRSYTSQPANQLMTKQEIIKKFVVENDLLGMPCNYVLSSEYSLNLVEAPAVEPLELSRALKWVLRDLVNFPIEEGVINTFELPFPRARDNIKMLYAVVMRKKIIPDIEKLINESGLVLNTIDIPELVLRNIMSLHPQYQEGCVCIQLESRGGRIILCKNDQICVTRSFERSLNGLLESTHEKEALETALDSLELEIQRSFDYLTSVFRQTIPNVIILAPNVMKKQLIQESLKTSLGAEVVFLNLTELLTFRKPIQEPDAVKCLLAMGAAIRQEEFLK